MSEQVWIDAVCVRRSGSQIGVPTRSSLFFEDTEFDGLVLGDSYRVFGVGMWGTTLVALAEVYTDPMWLPVGVFDFASDAFPSSWKFSILDPLSASGVGNEDQWNFLFGYERLVENEVHRDGIIEREPEELDSFRSLFMI